MWDIITASANIGQWFGLGGIGVLGLGAIMLYCPGLRMYALMGVACIAVSLFVYGKGVYDDAVLAEAKQKHVEEKATTRGTAAADNASRSVKRGVRTNDGWCRDCSK